VGHVRYAPELGVEFLLGRLGARLQRRGLFLEALAFFDEGLAGRVVELGLHSLGDLVAAAAFLFERLERGEAFVMFDARQPGVDVPASLASADGSLYLIPLRGDRPGAVEAKARQLAFELSGREHIRIVGIDVVAASARLAGSAYCTFERCNFSYIAHYTLHYSIGQVEQGRDTVGSGETGIFVGGHDNAFVGSSVRFSAGAGFYLRGYHHTIHNCLIDEVSYVGHYTNAITDAVTDFVDYENFLVGGHVITYNTMRNAGRHFFNIHGNGTSQASRTRGPMDYMATLFAHNHLYNGMLQTKDAGFITGYYCSGGTLDGLSTRIVYNVMHDCYDIFAMRIDVLGIVYLDAGTCNVDLHHNLLWAAPGSLQRGLWYNTMCVAVSEHDNLFHPQFTRSTSTLQPADFPESRPFRFGHDFDDPPPLPVWPQLERVVFPADERAILVNGSRFQVGEVDFDGSRQSAVIELASDVVSLNSDRSARERPRHRKVTDPLVLEAVHSDGRDERIKEQWTFVYETAGDSWLRFQGVPLGEGYRRFRVVYGNDRAASRKLEVRLDRLDGPLAASVDLPPTDKPRAKRIQIYAEAMGEVSAQAAGTRDVYVVFRSGDEAPVGEFEYFRFEGYRGEIALQPTEAKIELRIDSPTGDKIGEFYPRATGGPAVYREMVAPLEAVTGKHRVYAVVRSVIDGSIGTIRAFRIEKARMPIDWRGVGDAPRRKGGSLVYPEPTNLPCARPADKYPKRAGSA